MSNDKNKGQFWTPDWVADAMVAYMAKNTKIVFDPATGAGAFLRALRKYDRTRNVQFYGVDIDPALLQEEIYTDSMCTVELRDFVRQPPQGKFNAIVANPPYIRHHRLDLETKSILRQRSIEIIGDHIDGRAGYHVYFLIQALHLLDHYGRLAFIMPADTCEGVFAGKLFNWITKHYCLECVVTFANEATPFPGIDTNAVVFLIKNTMPGKEMLWVRVHRAKTGDLYDLIESDFTRTSFDDLSITKRDLDEALETGLSRPKQPKNNFKYRLGDFAKVIRGIATGANEFFFLTREEAIENQIPDAFLRRAIGRTRDIVGDILTKQDIQELEHKGRPTLLLSITGDLENLPKPVMEYINMGERLGLPDRALIKQRKPWYKMEYRKPPPILFAYLGRRALRFIKNEADVVPLTGFLCVYPHRSEENHIDALLAILNHPETLSQLHLVGKSYGSGAIKVEPRSLERLKLSDNLIENYLSRGTPEEY